MTSSRWLSLFLAWTLLLQSLTPALAAPPSPATEHRNRIGLQRQQLGSLGMSYGVVKSENHEFLVDTSQPYAEVIQEKAWVTDGAGTSLDGVAQIYRYDIGLDRLHYFKYQMPIGGPTLGSPVLSEWLLFDGLGSTRALVGDSGSVVDEFGYNDAFVIPYRVTANGGGRAVAGPGFFLNGQQWDGGSGWGGSIWSGSPAFNSGEGLYFNRARYYQPGLGRFVGEDSFGGNVYEPRTLHRYLYVANDSVNKVDPSGNFELSIMGLMAGMNISVITDDMDAARVEGGKQVAKKSFTEKLFDVYICANFDLDLKSFGSISETYSSGIHMYLFIGPKGNPGGMGIAYDVGVVDKNDSRIGSAAGNGAVFLQGNNISAARGRSTHGFVESSRVSLNEIKKGRKKEDGSNYGPGYVAKVAEFNGLQYGAWVLEAELLGMAQDEWEGEVAKDFVGNLVRNSALESFFQGTWMGRPLTYFLSEQAEKIGQSQWNCISWTLKSALAAVVTANTKK